MQTTLFALTLEAHRNEIARQVAASRKGQTPRNRMRWLKRS